MLKEMSMDEMMVVDGGASVMDYVKGIVVAIAVESVILYSTKKFSAEIGAKIIEKIVDVMSSASTTRYHGGAGGSF